MLHESNSEKPPSIPPPIFISTPVNYNDFVKSILVITGENGFECKSTSKHLKLSTTSTDSYRLIIHLLNKNKYEYFTYQAKKDKPYRDVIRNLHPTTDINYIKDELTLNGFSVRNISNIQSRISKLALPIFFVELAPNNLNIFKLISLCYTKIKIEEPHSQRDLSQYLRYQDYGPTKAYFNREPRCVRCGSNHLSELCEKSKDTPPSCILCGELHPANYKGCVKHKLL
jgi:PAX-interacting protein 1